MNVAAVASKTLQNLIVDHLGVLLFLAVWEIAPRIGWADAQFIPPLSQVLTTAWKLAITGELFIHIAISLARTLAGFILAVLLALPLGFILGGWAPGLARFLHPLITSLAQINAFTLFPLFIVVFGIGEIGKISIIFWSTIWPVLFTTIAGIRQVDPIYVKSARSMGANGMDIFSKVILPGAIESIFTGIRMGASMAFMMLIGAEMIGADTGLGWMIQNSEINNLIPRLYAAVLTIAALGVGLNVFLHWLETSIVVWKDAGGDEQGQVLEAKGE